MSVASLEKFVHPGPWTIADVEALPETGSRFEILAPGVLTVSPAPAPLHQRASRSLANMLEAAAQAAGVDLDILEVVNVELPGERLAMPDIALVDGEAADANTVRFQPSQVHLIVEIVSPGSRATDRAIKPDLYAEAGIPTYWLLELEPRPQLLVFKLGPDGYQQVAVINAGETGDAAVGDFVVRLDPAELIVRPRPTR
jgi:Uma2 family endonuclease